MAHTLRRRVTDALRQTGGATVSTLSARLGVSWQQIHRELTYLRNEGRVRQGEPDYDAPSARPNRGRVPMLWHVIDVVGEPQRQPRAKPVAPRPPVPDSDLPPLPPGWVTIADVAARCGRQAGWVTNAILRLEIPAIRVRLQRASGGTRRATAISEADARRIVREAAKYGTDEDAMPGDPTPEEIRAKCLAILERNPQRKPVGWSSLDDEARSPQILTSCRQGRLGLFVV